MATIKLQNGKVITKDGKVSCNCCACFGCGSVAEITDATTITIGGIVGDVFNIPAQSVSIVEPYDIVEYQITEGDGSYGQAGGGLCGAGNGGNFLFPMESVHYTAGVGFEITKKDDECVVGLFASYSFGGPADYFASGFGGTTIPLANLIGTHSFTFPVTGCFYPPDAPPICNTTNFNAVITIA
jgi:hypothetical protein